MTSEKSKKKLKKLGFEMTDYGYYGIYRHEVFENKDIKFIVCMDKCFYESYVYAKSEEKRGGNIIEIARNAINNKNYLVDELTNEKNQSVFAPNRCVRILIDNYNKIFDYLNT